MSSRFHAAALSLSFFLLVVPGPGRAQPPEVSMQRLPQYMIALEGIDRQTSPEQRQALLDALLARVDAADGVRLRWLRPVAVGAEVVVLEGIEDAQGIQALMAAIAALPEVRHVEVDAINTIGPGPRPSVLRVKDE